MVKLFAVQKREHKELSKEEQKTEVYYRLMS